MKTGKLVCSSVCHCVRIRLRIHMQLLKATNYESKFVSSSSQQPKQRCFEALVNDQLEAQLLYFIIRLLQSSTSFEQRRAHHQEVKLY